ncbi:MAG: bifunctional nuclease family protein [Capsulimonadales bacterium]|nr:bifunctional nuclease family protein [Capsulimonadales bacterium]
MADDFRDLNLGDLFRDWQPSEERPKRGESGSGENPYESSSETENRVPRALNEKEVRVLGIWGAHDPKDPDSPPKQTFVLLRDNRGRKAPIFIGPFETVAIQMAIEEKSPERPLTHDLLRNVIERMGGKVERVTIDDLWQSTFYARITITLKDNQTIDIDARPSDAIALALRTRSPIYMAEDVIEVAGREDE